MTAHDKKQAARNRMDTRVGRLRGMRGKEGGVRNIVEMIDNGVEARRANAKPSHAIKKYPLLLQGYPTQVTLRRAGGVLRQPKWATSSHFASSAIAFVCFNCRSLVTLQDSLTKPWKREDSVTESVRLNARGQVCWCAAENNTLDQRQCWYPPGHGGRLHAFPTICGFQKPPFALGNLVYTSSVI